MKLFAIVAFLFALALPVHAGELAAGQAKVIPPIVSRALAELNLPEFPIVVLESPKAFLLERGIDKKQAEEIERNLSAFTLGESLPVYVNVSTANVESYRLETLFRTEPDQAAKMMASNIFHELRHAVNGEGEVIALKKQIAILEYWKMKGDLRLADSFIAGKKRELKDVEKRGDTVFQILQQER
jgi:hypothetical protein